MTDDDQPAPSAEARRREQRLNALFVKLADTLVDDYDAVALLHELVTSCADILDIDAGGLMLADAENSLHVVVSTSEDAELVEIMQLDAGEGPCIECFSTGASVAIADVASVREKWPAFARAAASGGYHSLFATPLKLRGRTIGAMNLFSKRVGDLNAEDIATARALADVATIGILQERLIREAALVTEQLQQALESRIFIEQAKGVVSESLALDLDEAFTWMRAYARDQRQTLRWVAESLTTRALDPAALRASLRSDSA